jgi:hypothetical protein
MKIAAFLLVLGCLAVNGLAHAQTSGIAHLPVGLAYEFSFTAPQSAATRACLHEVSVAGNPAVATFVDKNGDGEITDADAFSCTSDFVKDGVTVNKLTHTFSPPVASQTPVALRAYDGSGPLDPRPSVPSDWHVLVTVLPPFVLLD